MDLQKLTYENALQLKESTEELYALYSTKLTAYNDELDEAVNFMKNLLNSLKAVSTKLNTNFSEMELRISKEAVSRGFKTFVKMPRNSEVNAEVGEILKKYNEPSLAKDAFLYFSNSVSSTFVNNDYYAQVEGFMKLLCGCMLGLAKAYEQYNAMAVDSKTYHQIVLHLYVADDCMKSIKDASDNLKNVVGKIANADKKQVIQNSLVAGLRNIYSKELLSSATTMVEYPIHSQEDFYKGYMAVQFVKALDVEKTSPVDDQLLEWIRGFFKENKADEMFQNGGIMIPVVATPSNYQAYYFKDGVQADILKDIFVQYLARTNALSSKVRVFIPQGTKGYDLLDKMQESFVAGMSDAYGHVDTGDHAAVQMEFDEVAQQNGSMTRLFAFFDFPKAYTEEELAFIKTALQEGKEKSLYVVLVGSADQKSESDKPQLVSEMEALCVTAPQFSLTQSSDEKAVNQYLEDRLLICRRINRIWGHKLNDFGEGVSSNAYMPYEFPEHDEFPQAICIGTCPKDLQQDMIGTRYEIADHFKWQVAQVVSTVGNQQHGMIMCNEETVGVAQKFLHNVMWGYLAGIPITKLNICVIDGKRRGLSISPFLNVSKEIPELFDGRIHTDSDEIYERLLRMNNYISECIQTKLGNQFENIIAYNNAFKERSEAIQLLIINDYPCGFDDERSKKLLCEILANGSKCGIYAYISCNEDIKSTAVYDNTDSYISQMKDSVFLNLEAGQDSIENSIDEGFYFDLTPFVSGAKVDYFKDNYKKHMKSIKRKGIDFNRILDAELFARKSTYSLDIPIGIGDEGKIIKLSFGKGSSHHALIAGGTGSGKSTLLHTLIMSAMMHYSPDELNLYLMDFKNGTEFKVYESAHLPHIKLLALEAMQEFGESIFEELVTEMTRRADAFKDAGVSSLKDYVEQTGKTLPRILIVMDEFQILFNCSENNQIANHSAELAKRIVTEGRSFGIHLLMATQSTHIIRELAIAQGTIDQMFIRVGMKCVEDDANYLFTTDKGLKALDMMKGELGVAVMTQQYVEEGLTGLRVAYCDKEAQKNVLEQIAGQFKDYPSEIKIFEASRTTKLLDALQSQNLEEETKHAEVMIGDLIKVAPPLKLTFAKRGVHNVLICSSAAKDALAMSSNLFNILTFGVAQSKSAKIYCIDGDVLLDEEDDETRDLYDLYADRLEDFTLAETEGDIIKFVKEIFDIFKARKREKSDVPVFVMIKGLESLDLIKDMMKNEEIDESDYIDVEDDWNEAPADEDDIFGFGTMDTATNDSNVASQFLKLVGEGTKYGIHFVVTCSEYQTVRENMYYGENILTKFPERFVFSMNEDDANELIEGISVQSLKSNMVYYSNHVSMKCQVKPYVFPTVEELETYLN